MSEMKTPVRQIIDRGVTRILDKDGEGLTGWMNDAYGVTPQIVDSINAQADLMDGLAKSDADVEAGRLHSQDDVEREFASSADKVTRLVAMLKQCDDELGDYVNHLNEGEFVDTARGVQEFRDELAALLRECEGEARPDRSDPHGLIDEYENAERERLRDDAVVFLEHPCFRGYCKCGGAASCMTRVKYASDDLRRRAKALESEGGP